MGDLSQLCIFEGAATIKLTIFPITANPSHPMKGLAGFWMLNEGSGHVSKYKHPSPFGCCPWKKQLHKNRWKGLHHRVGRPVLARSGSLGTKDPMFFFLVLASASSNGKRQSWSLALGSLKHQASSVFSCFFLGGGSDKTP